MDKKDALGERMKNNYEFRSRSFLPRRSYTILRIDGRCFHEYTKQLPRPFDDRLHNDLCKTAIDLCAEISGSVFGYVQSDEISLLTYDFATIHTEPWFGGNIQKIVSCAAAFATARFNEYRSHDGSAISIPATFDARVFCIPDPTEVANYFIWRQQDATRNSIQSAGRAYFSHKELNKKSNADVQDMLIGKGINWNDYPTEFKRGSIIDRHAITKPISYRKNDGELIEQRVETVEWAPFAPPIFTKEPNYLIDRIPVYE